MKRRYRALAEAEVQEIASAYDEAMSGLGGRFLEALELVYGRLVRFPYSAEEVLPEIRRVPVHRFPYLVYYTVQEDAIEIVAVVHHARHERAWKEDL